MVYIKRFISIILIMLSVFGLCSCDSVVSDEDETMIIQDFDDEQVLDDEEDDNDFFIGAWLSYMELSEKNAVKNAKQYENYISGILDNLKKVGVTNLFVQVRPFADSIYPSKLFPASEYTAEERGAGLPFDFLKIITQSAKKRGIGVHAWINPYRIQREYDKDKLCPNSDAQKWFDGVSDCAVKVGGGLYFNPASEKAKKLIINGVREILENYDVEGIHIDDYFYPAAEESFDKSEYDAYRKSGGTLGLSDWRRENVNSLVSGIYCAVKAVSKEKVFSISPGGDIDKDRDEMFADVELWSSQEGYCDIIMPQIYYGFKNKNQPFEQCALRWKSLCGKKVRLVPGLALYKAGKEDAFAGESGADEWLTSDDIIKRQAEFLKENNFDGFCLYSAKYVNFNKNILGKQTENLVLWYNNLKLT